MKEKVVISASASMPEVIEKWKTYWADKGFDVIYPVIFDSEEYPEHYANVHSQFCSELASANVHFIANEDGKGQKGYIGIGVFTELAYRVCANITSSKQTKIVLLKEPDNHSPFYSEIMRWIRLGWIELF